MRLSFPKVLAAALSMGLLTAAPADAQAASYDFVVVADSADGYQPSGLSCPALNDAGQVAFSAESTDDEELVLRGTGGPLTTMAAGGDEYRSYRGPSINSDGDVAFVGDREDGTTELYRSNGVIIQTIATTLRGFDDLSGLVSLNDAGRVAFDAQRPGFKDGLFLSGPVRVRPVYTFDTSDFRGTGDLFSGPSLGDGAVAFNAVRPLGSSEPDGVFRRATGGALTTIAETSDGGIYKFRGVTMNATGEVAFMAFLESGNRAIMAGSGGPVRTVVDTEGPFRAFNSTPPSINDAGTVAFIGALDDRTGGLFVGPDPVADRVVGPGDALAGSTVEDISACGEALNNVGQLAFAADLVDGRRVIVRADPA